MFNRDAFRPASKEELAERDARQQEALRRIHETREAARNCLRTELFQKYTQSYIKAHDSIMDLFLSISDEDPMKRLTKYDRLQAEAVSLRSLLKGVVNDAKEAENKKDI